MMYFMLIRVKLTTYRTYLRRYIFFFKQKTAYEMRISDWSSDVCSSDLHYPTPQELDPAQRDRGGGRVLDQLSRADTGPGVTDTAQRDRRPPRGERTRRVGPDILRPTSPASDPDILACGKPRSRRQAAPRGQAGLPKAPVPTSGRAQHASRHRTRGVAG